MGSRGASPVPVGDLPTGRSRPQLRRSELFVADGSQPAKSPVGAASSASMPLLRSGIEAEDAAPTGLLAGWDPSATNSSLLRSCGLDLPVGKSPTGTGEAPRLPIFRTLS